MHQLIAISTEQGSSKRHEIRMNGLKILASIIAEHHVRRLSQSKESFNGGEIKQDEFRE